MLSVIEQIFGEQARFDFTIGEILEHARTEYGAKIAYSSQAEKRAISFEKVVDRARDVAASLTLAGVTPGSRVALFMTPGPDWMISFLAISLCGAITVPVGAHLTKSKIFEVLTEADAQTILFDSLFYPYSEHLYRNYSHIKQFEIRKFEKSSKLHPEANAPLGSMFQGLHGEDLAILHLPLDSSGELGAVMICLKNLLFEAHILNQAAPIPAEGVLLSLLPSTAPLEFACALLFAFLSGTQVSIGASQGLEGIKDQLKAEKITDVVCEPMLIAALKRNIQAELDDSRITRLWINAILGVAGLFRARSVRRLISYPARRRISATLHRLICGGGAVEKEVKLFFEKMGIEVLQGHGMTSTGLSALTVNLFNTNSSQRSLSGAPLKAHLRN